MIQRRLISELNLDSQALRTVSLVMEKVTKGSEEVLTSPITNETSPSDILSGWDKIFDSKLSLMNSTLIDIEMNNRSKFGPRSIAIPWSERRQSLLSYFGVNRLGSDLASPFQLPRRLRPLSNESALTYLKNSSNSGAPSFSRKSRVKGAILANFESEYNKQFPCILFTRTQENNKTRNVWGYPISDTLAEMRYYRPLLDYQKKLPWRSALNKPEDIDKGITKIIKAAQINPELSILSMDFSAYDASVKDGLQKASFNYISSLFQSQYSSEIERLYKRFNSIGIITPEGIFSGPHGIPSGSTFTNEVDSISQYLIAINSGFANDPSLMQIQGDDGVYLVSKPDPFKDSFRKYGLQVNDDKSYISRDYVVYLQSLFHKEFSKSGVISGIYSTYRALLRIVYLERFIDLKDEISGKDYFAIRTLSILENCKHHPLFREFVLYVLSIDKYNLEFSDQGLRSFVKMRRDQEGKDITFRNWSYGEDVVGIYNYDSYKIIKEYV